MLVYLCAFLRDLRKKKKVGGWVGGRVAGDGGGGGGRGGRWGAKGKAWDWWVVGKTGKEKSSVEFVFTKRQNFVYTTLVCIFIHKVEPVL